LSRPATAGTSTAAHDHGGRLGSGVQPKDTTEGATEVRVENGVDERVEETVHVAEPRK